MSMDVEAPCEACGGLLPLEAIQTRRTSGRHHHWHRHSCSIHPEEKKPDLEPEESKSSHRRKSEQESTSQGTRESRRSRRLSSNSGGQAEVNNRLSYGQLQRAAKPEQLQAAFDHQKAEKEVVRCGIHGDQEHTTEREPYIPCQRAQSGAPQPAPSDLQYPKIILNLGDLDLPCHLHRYSESTCTRVVRHLPQEAASNFSSNPSVSTSQMERHVGTQMSCKRLLASSKQTRRDEEATVAAFSQTVALEHEECASPYPGVYEECHLHHIEERIAASPRSSSRDSQRCGLHPEQEESFFTCVVHPRGSPNLCERCGLPEPAQNGFSPQGTNDGSHHSRVKLCAQMSSPRSELHSPCVLHGDSASDTSKAPAQYQRPKKGKIHGCHLHREPPASEEPRLRWLDRILATQRIPPQIIREFLQGRRGWPPEAMKQKCPGCIRKQTDEGEDDGAPNPNFTSWDPGSSVALSAVREHRDGKLARLLMARTRITKPVVKLSTSRDVWRSRREFQVCSECWNPTKFGRWASILKEMARENTSGAADMSNCDRKFPSCTAHGNPNPTPNSNSNLRCPQLFSTLSLRLQAQELQNETFDRKTASKVARVKCIKLDEQALAQVREKRSPPRVDRTKQASPALQRCLDAMAQRRQEPYVGLSKIEQPPTLICRIDSKRRGVAVQANRPKLMPKPPERLYICPNKIHSPKDLLVHIKPKKRA